MSRLRRLALLTLTLALLVTGCSKKPTSKEATPTKAPRVISAYTSGTISREANVRVRFVDAMVEASAIGVSLPTPPFDFDPDIEGIAVWTSPRDLEFRPSEHLEPGQTYRAELDLEQLTEVLQGRDTLRFDFEIMTQSYQVTLEGFRAADSDNPAQQTYGALLTTADVAANSDIEKILVAEHQGRILSVSWSHAEGGREHRLLVEGIERQSDDSELTLVWNGAAIGVERQDKNTAQVPGLNKFNATGARGRHLCYLRASRLWQTTAQGPPCSL